MLRASIRLRALAMAAVVLTTAALALATVPAGAVTNTWFVSPSGSDSTACSTPSSPCKTIGQAVTNAAAGDTISVAAGTYTEQVTINKQLTVTGAGAATTLIDATAKDHAVLITGAASAGTSLDGFTLENALLEGLLATQTANLTITHNTFTNN